MPFVAASQHARHEAAHAVHHAHQVDGQDPVPVLQAVLPGRLPQRRCGHAGVVAQRVRRAEALVGGVGQTLDAGGIGHVHRHPDRLRALPLHVRQRALQRRGLDVGQHQLHAGRGKARGHRQADAAGRAGDHGDASS
jgi:hypothetical protein